MTGSAPYQVLPPLSEDEYAALREDIAEQGVLVPIDVDEHGNILDGHHRMRICGELGISPPTTRRDGLTEAGKIEHALRLNLQRRHPSVDQRRELARAELVRDPDRSDRAIARLTGVDHKTVGKLRRTEVGQPTKVESAEEATEALAAFLAEARAARGDDGKFIIPAAYEEAVDRGREIMSRLRRVRRALARFFILTADEPDDLTVGNLLWFAREVFDYQDDDPDVLAALALIGSRGVDLEAEWQRFDDECEDAMRDEPVRDRWQARTERAAYGAKVYAALTDSGAS
jgi:hypothetical protein